MFTHHPTENPMPNCCTGVVRPKNATALSQEALIWWWSISMTSSITGEEDRVGGTTINCHGNSELPRDQDSQTLFRGLIRPVN